MKSIKNTGIILDCWMPGVCAVTTSSTTTTNNCQLPTTLETMLSGLASTSSTGHQSAGDAVSQCSTTSSAPDDADALYEKDAARVESSSCGEPSVHEGAADMEADALLQVLWTPLSMDAPLRGYYLHLDTQPRVPTILSPDTLDTFSAHFGRHPNWGCNFLDFIVLILTANELLEVFCLQSLVGLSSVFLFSVSRGLTEFDVLRFARVVWF